MVRTFSVGARLRALELVNQVGLTKAATILQVRYARIRAIVEEEGWAIKRGRRISQAIEQRNAKIIELRLNREMSLAEIGARFGISAERVRQVVDAFSERQSQGQSTDAMPAANAVMPTPATACAAPTSPCMTIRA